MEHTTTKEDVATLLENFANYVNPKGELDPWFTLAEINQQFAWDDVPNETLVAWLLGMQREGLVELKLGETANETEVRWLS